MSFNRTGGVLSYLNIDQNDIENNVVLSINTLGEAKTRERNFSSLQGGRKTKFYVENLITGSFSRIRNELHQEDIEIEDEAPTQKNNMLELDLFEEMEKWSFRVD